MKNSLSKLFLAALIVISVITSANAQLTVTSPGDNRKASISEMIGITDVTIHYSRPGVKGREGHIWGQLIPQGYTNQGFGSSKAAPWRAGANENTTIEFSTDVKIDGQPLAAGIYGFFIDYEPNECTLIFSKNATSWGSFYYDPSEDALRIKVKPVPSEKSVEWLKYDFVEERPASAVVQLQWEKLIIPFKVEVDVIGTQLASFRKELRSQKGFTWEPWDQAAQWCLQHRTNFKQALQWADTATNAGFGGNQNFQALSTKAALLDSLGRHADANAVIKSALPFADMLQLYRYAITLVLNKRDKEAIELFKSNYEKHPDQFVTNIGMARAYSAAGDYKKALPFAQKAVTQATDDRNRGAVERYVKKLQDGQDINH